MTKAGLLYFLLITLFACSSFGDRVDKKKLSGRYELQIGNRDTLDVYSNGTYSYYRRSQGRKLHNSGTWNYNASIGEVNFTNFSFLSDSISIADSTFLPKGNWMTRIKTKNNEISFVYASDVGNRYFLKVDSLDNKKRD